MLEELLLFCGTHRSVSCSRQQETPSLSSVNSQCNYTRQPISLLPGSDNVILTPAKWSMDSDVTDISIQQVLPTDSPEALHFFTIWHRLFYDNRNMNDQIYNAAHFASCWESLGKTC